MLTAEFQDAACVAPGAPEGDARMLECSCFDAQFVFYRRFVWSSAVAPISIMRTSLGLSIGTAILGLASLIASTPGNAQAPRSQLGLETPRVTLARAQVRRESRRGRSNRDRGARGEASPKRTVKPQGPRVPLVAIVSLRSQRIHVYGAEGVVAQSRVSTGQAGHRTPAGIFSILQRNRHHESNIYSGAPMPYMQRLTWSGIALHQGHVPGYPASHGCIRLPGGFASNLWGMGHIGMRVLVTPADVAPVPIAHAHLPQPVMTPIASIPGMVSPVVRTASASETGAIQDVTVVAPYKLAVARKAKALEDRKTTAAAVKPAFGVAAERAAEANAASAALRAAVRALAVAEEDLRAANAARVRAEDEAGKAKVATAMTEASVRLATAQAAHGTVRAEERRLSDAAFDAVKEAKAATAAAETAKGAAREAAVALEPVSVFVSRKAGRVYVRQGFVPLHDEPITLADQDRPTARTSSRPWMPPTVARN
ncbi:MAG: L,D-transpeptidase family protein [Hyphomicrobiaceae bacterium]